MPQPIGRFAEHSPPLAAPAASNPVFHFYDFARQSRSGTNVSADYSQPAPFLSSSDYHSSAEIIVETANARQIIEAGWTVNRAVNHDSRPHLFIYHWVNGAATCFNGCGYVQVSRTRFPGMAVTVTTAPQGYGIAFFQNRWWIGYQGEWIGYFPAALWGNIFTRFFLTIWMGDVAASSAAPCTDMGTGVPGPQGGSAIVTNMAYDTITPARARYGQTKGALYAISGFTGSSFHYGGPGAC